jgi:Zn-dependent oligopeptidase
MVQGAKMLVENSKEVTKINIRLSKEEKNFGKNSTARTSDKSPWKPKFHANAGFPANGRHQQPCQATGSISPH